ncbi:MAG: ABC transporter ATP-binding protein [Atopobiaceae bacterium]|nr:ABC transporter ATP-binding protein [Atopobiaceae bacterium]
MATEVLQAHKLTKRYFREGRGQARYFDAVSDVSLHLQAGGFTAITGRSGCGKTTLLTMLAGLLEPDEGEVVLDDKSLYTLSDAELSRLRNTHIGMVPQIAAAIKNLNVFQNVVLPAGMYNAHDEQAAHERAHQLLERLEIAELESAWPELLSGGELRRMAIARSLVCSPALILADEPTADLDSQSTKLVLELLKEQAGQGCAVAVVSHDAEVNAYADVILEMDAGRLT